MSLKETGRLEVIQQVTAKQLTQAKAAERLGISRRQVIRLCQRYREEGLAGLISKRRGKASNHKLSRATKEKAIAFIIAHYRDFGPTLAHEKLSEKHGLTLSVESCRKLMIKERLWKGKKRKKCRTHQMRARRSAYGELVQIDGSSHAWFEDRAPKCTLLVFVDDATGKIIQLHFEQEETCAGYMQVIKKHILRDGRPLAYYSDRHGIFRVNIKEAQSGTGETQLSRALRELDIDLINANSPQAKGRVEKMNRTLQDRLVKELRIQGISDIASANKFLPEFIISYNKRFSVEPASASDAHRKEIPNPKDLDLILCQRHIRTITKNLEVHYQNKIYQIQTDTVGYSMRKSKVYVHDKNGQIILIYKGNKLRYKIFDKNQKPTPIASSKQINAQVDQKKHWKPAANHPWKKYSVTVQPRSS